jgi:hypothetical protein
VNIKIILAIPFDVRRLDSLHNDLPRWWIEQRLALFNEYTLRSLEYQSDSNFEVWLRCDAANRELTENYGYRIPVKCVYDNNKYDGSGGFATALRSEDSDYVVLFRIDSDDLLRYDAVATIRRAVRPVDDGRGCLKFVRCYDWYRFDSVVGTYFNSTPPFTGHIIPKSLYRDWKYISSFFFNQHGKLTIGASYSTNLPDFKVCVHRHNLRSGPALQGKTIQKKVKFNNKQRLAMIADGTFKAIGNTECLDILKDFGLGVEQVYV